MRRILLALTISLAVHLGLVAVAIGVGLWRTISLFPAVKMQPITIEMVKDLPLGPLASKAAGPEPAPERAVPKRKLRVAAAHGGVTIPASPDAGAPEKKSDASVKMKNFPLDGGASIDGGRKRPGDLRSNGPEGSRLIAVLRLDRLRASPGSEKTIAAVDQLLLLLPDRHTLIEGTGLDLFRDFDSLLIATPNPTDVNVTFLAARHHLSDAAIRAGLDRAAMAAQRPIEWKTIAGRPVGIRQQKKVGSGAYYQDDRILALPQNSLAVMATLAYASQLLGTNPSAPSNPLDGGVVDAGRPARKLVPRTSWQDLVTRIDAEDSAMPEDAAFMMAATNLFKSVASKGYVVPSTRGSADDNPLPAAANETNPVPQLLTLVVGVEAPYIEIVTEFATAEEATKWEQEIPIWRRKFLTNPVVFALGFSSLLGRVQTSREETTLLLRAETSTEELQRLLNVIVNLAQTVLSKPR
jgi:hypothetical protein